MGFLLLGEDWICKSVQGGYFHQELIILPFPLFNFWSLGLKKRGGVQKTLSYLMQGLILASGPYAQMSNFSLGTETYYIEFQQDMFRQGYIHHQWHKRLMLLRSIRLRHIFYKILPLFLINQASFDLCSVAASCENSPFIHNISDILLFFNPHIQEEKNFIKIILNS